MNQTKETYINALIDCRDTLQNDFCVSHISIFGSIARGDASDGSDIDLLVEMPPKIFLLSGLKLFLEEKLQRSVDLIRSNSRLSKRFINVITPDVVAVF